MFYKIGIDVGGTNTDAVLVSQDNKILAKTKQSTTLDVSSGIENALEEVISSANIPTDLIQYIMLGTTHCTNALVERKSLNRVGAIRIGLPASKAVPTMVDYPDDLKELLGKHLHLVHGGYEFDGRLISPLDHEEIKEKLNPFAQKTFGSDIVTEIKPSSKFYRAEEYHQKYFQKNS